MFNHFFYACDGVEVCKRFLTEAPSTTAIVIDPPFGGLAEILSTSIKSIWEMAGTGKCI